MQWHGAATKGAVLRRLAMARRYALSSWCQVAKNASAMKSAEIGHLALAMPHAAIALLHGYQDDARLPAGGCTLGAAAAAMRKGEGRAVT
jgi:hypothetical protein